MSRNGSVRATALAAGAVALAARTVGLAQVKDLTTIADEKARLRAERICLTAAKKFIKNRETYQTGSDFLQTLKDAVTAFPRD